MKKMKTLILALALGFTVAAAATTVGCNKNKGDESSSTPTIESVENFASVTFEKLEVSVYQYEGISLACRKKGTTEPIVFTSSDDSVASVDANGNVTAKDKVGRATITATAGEATATCVVKVEKSPYHPQIALNSKEYTLEEGNALEFNVTTLWNKQELPEDITYAVAFAENSQNAKAAVSVEGNVVKVVADTAESIDVVLSATVRGLYTSEQFTVNVIAPPLKILPMDVAFMPANGEYVATISSTDLIGDMANSVPMNFTVAKGAQTMENVDVTWTVEGTAAALEEGNLVGKEVGTATLTGTAVYEDETATITVICDVIPPETTLDETIFLELQAPNLTYTFKSELLGKLVSAELHGVKVSSRARDNTILFKKDSFPMQAQKLGKQEMVISTTLVRYIVPAEVYTMVINDADELDQMRIIANTGEVEYSNRFGEERNSQFFDGYYILGNDIAYNKRIKSMTDTGSVWMVQGTEADDNRGFKGVFDGCGYNIDGVTVGDHPSGDKKQAGGIFGYIALGGIVKNVSFTNAVLEANNGFICARGNGTIENVSVHYKKIGGDKETSGINSNTVRTMGTFFSFAAGPKAMVKNCLVDASAAEIALEYGSYNGSKTMNMNLVGKAVNIENVIALCPDMRVLETSGADIKLRNYTELMADGDIMKVFDQTYWTTVDGVPMFVKQAESLNFDAPVGFLNVKPALVAGFNMLVLASNPYTKIDVEEVEGVTFENSMLFATEEAFTKTVTLTVTSLFNAENKATIEVYIDSFGEEVAAPTTDKVVVYFNNPVLTIGDNSWMGEKNYLYIGADIYSIGDGEEKITLDWKKFGWEKQSATVVSIKNDVRTHFDVDLQITYPVSDISDSVKVQDSVFSAYRGNEYILTDVASDIPAPEGYENIHRLDGDKDWSTALERQFFNETDLSAYKEVWFAMKIVNGFWVMRGQWQLDTLTDWVYFHYIQIEDGVWAVEVSTGTAHFITEFNVLGVNLRYMTYREGYGNGLLLYNNNGHRPAGENTSIYATEIRGVLKDAN